MNPEIVTLTSTWFIKPGNEEAVYAALGQLAAAVNANEPGTLTYLVHSPYAGPGGLQSLPPGNPQTVVFFEMYQNADAFEAHVQGPLFSGFVGQFGNLFVQDSHGNPYTEVQFLSYQAGFTRPGVIPIGWGELGATENAHPAVMFEVIAEDQERLKAFYQSVFGWNYTIGTGEFAYVNFSATSPSLLGGIGQSRPDTPGFEPGRNFYLLVADLQIALDQVVQAGGSPFVEPVAVDGYEFAMAKDPEGNVFGLIKPFTA